MRKMFILGLTGPSGAGKSLAAQRFVFHGFAHLDADKTARVVVEPGSPCLKELAEVFGKDIIKADGSLDRKKLAQLAFGGGRVEELNAVTHPYITKEIERELERLEKAGYRFAVLDAPALFESGADKMCDSVMAVTASRELRIKRIMDRDKITFEQAAARVDAQPDESFYKDRSDYVACSDGGTPELFAAVDRVVEIIKQKYNGG